MNGMQMGPPAGGDPLGAAILVLGALVTIASFALAIRFTLWPGERDASHPKYLILREDR
ncbi:MAG TPA: hypothetical protein VHD76_10760 [Bryobacteraceae bacterium]|jgi:hypothetical protein|nr:hypothetical protein [Bryobacteraceae bacterium]